MVKLDQERVAKLRGLPPRLPRGSPENIVRALMAPYLLSGMTVEEAREKAKGGLLAAIKFMEDTYTE